jgi:hypothetical protein
MSETVETCPTDVVGAAVERVWALLTNPSLLHWMDVRLIEAPARNLSVGDRALFAASFGLRVSWTVLALDQSRSITLDIGLPFGMVNRETVVLSPLDANRCRVTFN